MSQADYSSSRTEVVAVFHDLQSFQGAIDDLLLAGFDGAGISVLAHEGTITSKLGRKYRSTLELEDNSEVPRIGHVPDETIGDAEGAVVGASIYLPAIAGGLAVAASGGTMLGAFAAAAVAGGAGGLVGALLARYIGRQHARHLEQHLRHGGLLLWVRTPDAARENDAIDILDRHSAEDVHLHQIPERAGKPGDVPDERPRIIHILERPPESGRPPMAAA